MRWLRSDDGQGVDRSQLSPGDETMKDTHTPLPLLQSWKLPSQRRGGSGYLELSGKAGTSEGQPRAGIGERPTVLSLGASGGVSNCLEGLGACHIVTI